ncbi:hypothetical protein scyTo_0025193, partial [Scyliorhinus torazame]|nr:hypothetical protein [Scyliorhinus torazame]
KGKRNPSDIANALLDAISDYVVDFVQPSLSVIRIILFNPLLMDPFRQCMEQRFRPLQSMGEDLFLHDTPADVFYHHETQFSNCP